MVLCFPYYPMIEGLSGKIYWIFVNIGRASFFKGFTFPMLPTTKQCILSNGL